MITTIEQKLSAIKAINEAKDKVELNLQISANLLENLDLVESITFKTGEDTFELQDVPVGVLFKIVDLLGGHLEHARMNLIGQAEELMK